VVASLCFQAYFPMAASNNFSSGAPGEGATDAHHTEGRTDLRTYEVPDELARRAMVKLSRALIRHPNRELREGLSLLKGVFRDLL
jgi:hypothetical protein